MILTLKELSDYLRVNERTVLRMLKSGQLQGTKIGGQWRFNGSQIDSLFFPPGQVVEEVPLEDLTRSCLGIPVSRVMARERVVMDMRATDTAGVINELVAPAMFNSLVLDVQDARKRLLDRERLLSTGVGKGIAIPHPRDPIPTLRKPAVIVFGRSREGINYAALDGKPVHVFFLLCCQTIELHLHLLGRLAQLLRDGSFTADCRAVATAEDLLLLVLERERREFLAPAGETTGKDI